MRFSDYSEKYSVVKMTRDRGVLEMRFHTNDGPLVWSHIGGAHEELAQAFADVARDPDNLVVIMTGTGDAFSGPAASPDTFPKSRPEDWEVIRRNGVLLTTSLLNIDAPVISCVNGPALRHMEIALLADIVLAAPEATFQDSAHFANRTVPGDGVNLLMPLLMGFNRARYFLLTGQTLDAAKALEFGLVSEILPREKLLGRARELADGLLGQNPLVLRYSRRVLMQPLRQLVGATLEYGLALEGLAAVHESARMNR